MQVQHRCRLCRRHAPLKKSHIFPEFLHEAGYDRKHRARQVSTSGRVRFLQKGWRERLLCGDCEQFINLKYELPFFRAWERDAIVSLQVAEIPRIWKVTGLDYATFKLFHLSILWRVSVSMASPFAYFTLEPTEEEEIRQMIIAGDPGPISRYMIVAISLLLERRVASSVIIPPFAGDGARGHRTYMVVFGGCAWHYFPNGSGDSRLDALALTEDGRMEVPTMDLLEFSPLDRMVREALASNPRMADKGEEHGRERPLPSGGPPT